MLTVLAFITAIALLIAVHEFGHYRMAVACGVRVLRFSIGFGTPLIGWKSSVSGTEFVIALIPLGGFVKMLDEREAPVEPALRHLAFNTQTLRRRFAIVAAGPLANLVLAVLLYSTVHWLGVDVAAAVLAQPAPGSIVAQAGLQGGERVVRAAFDNADLENVESYEDIHWLATRATLESRDVQLAVTMLGQTGERLHLLRLSELDTDSVDGALFEKIGLSGPFTTPVIGDIMTDSAAMQAGLLHGDRVLQVNREEIVDGQQLRRLIRDVVQRGAGTTQTWHIRRHGQIMQLKVTPRLVADGDRLIGRIGAYVGEAPEMVLVRYGFLDGLWRATVKTWDISALTLKMMGKMLIGEASVKNISGPITIADYAGRSADMGLTSYVTFLALISVSLGVLNLLPLPVLDGGHLMYYLWEGVTGKPVSDVWMEKLQQGGMVILGVLMMIALYNDLSRFLPGT